MTRPLKIALVNHSDTLGGASVVTYRLMNALRHEDVDARMVVYAKTTDSPYVYEVGNRFMRGFKFLCECGASAFVNGFDRSNLFTVSTATSGLDFSDHPWIVEADVIVLNWINQGMLSMRTLKKLFSLGKPVVWTMHDMWCMTGVCHHSHECVGYKSHCGHCPLLKGGRVERDYSYKLVEKKRRLYDGVPLTFVAVSNWLGKKARESALLRDKDVRVIPNAFPLKSFHIKPEMLVQTFDVDYSRNLIMMVAARLDDPIKGLDYAIAALNHIFDTNPHVANTSMAVFLGGLHNPNAFKDLRFPYRHLGRIDDPQVLVNLYASSRIVISTSLYETLPGTLIEGQASGCIPVSFGEGGQSDIIEHGHNGYIAKYKSSLDVARGIVWALNSNLDRQFLRDEVERKFDSKAIAGAYIGLFEELLGKK